VSGASDGAWRVGVWPRNAEGVFEIGTAGVAISDSDRAELTAALDLALELNGNAVLTSGQQAANTLFAQFDKVAKQGGWLAVEFRASVSAALGSWLGTITSTRVGLEDASRRHFPGDECVASAFSSAHAEDAHFRLAWELRNALHHEGDVAKYVHYTSEYDEASGRPVFREQVDLPRLLASPRLGAKARGALESLWGPYEMPDLSEVVLKATEVAEKIFSSLIRRHEDRFVAAVEAIVSAYTEVADGDNPVHLYRVHSSEQGGKLTISARPVDAVLIGYVASNVDAARRQAGMGPRFS
jgi:hypothetical protein